MSYEELSPEDTNAFITQVRDESLPGLFNSDYCKLYRTPFSFYKNGFLLTLENHTVAPPFTLEYFQSGDTVVYIDGGHEPFHLLNQNGCLILNESNVIDYLEFYCQCVNQRPKNILLLRNPDTMPYQDTVYIDFHFDKNNYGEKDFKVRRNDADNGYIVEAPFVFAGKIDPGIAQISDTGDIHIERVHQR
ncbi:MAG: hypothetical protein ACLFR0_00565 [Alphaproteobacteria bacterium]